MNDKMMARHERHEVNFKEAIAHNAKLGGSRTITYEGMEIVAPARDIHFAIDRFNTYGDKYRQDIMVSVNHSLAKAISLIKRGEATQELAMQTAQDVAIWFANEVAEGRATFSLN